MALEITVAIPTYNRRHIVARAIDSVLEQPYRHRNVLVIDDCSADGTVEFIRQRYPSVVCIRQSANAGPGPCRNTAVKRAPSDWVLMLDSDDTLLPGALERISERVLELLDRDKYPVFLFASTNAVLRHAYKLFAPEDLLRGELKGEAFPLFHRPLFLSKGYAYPELRIGGEDLLWLEIAQHHGLPVWDTRIIQLRGDADNRLSNRLNQVRRAVEYAELQDIYIARFGELMRALAPEALNQRYLGSAAYWLLAGNRELARQRLKFGFCGSGRIFALGIWILSFLPRRFAEHAFLAYRALTT